MKLNYLIDINVKLSRIQVCSNTYLKCHTKLFIHFSFYYAIDITQIVSNFEYFKFNLSSINDYTKYFSFQKLIHI